MKSNYFFIGIVFLLLIFNLGKWGLTETSEARYAEISKEMFDHHELLYPTLLDIAHFHKPPFTYYITMLGYFLFGENEFGARFFLQVAFIVQIILVYKTSILLFKSKRTALLSSLVYFTTPAVLISVRDLTTDAYLTTFIIASIYCWLLSIYKSRNYIYLFYLFLGLGFLTKGPLVLPFVIVFMIVWRVINRRSLHIDYRDLIGFTILLLISLWWYFLLYKNFNNIYDYFINYQLGSRVSSGGSFHRSKPFWFYLLLFPVAGIPWVPFLVWWFFNKKHQLNTLQSKQYRVLFLSFLIILITFSLFSTKLILYILPCYYFLCLILGSVINESSTKKNAHFYKYGILYVALLIFGIFLAPYFIETLKVSLWVKAYFLIIIGITFLIVKNQEYTFKGINLIVGATIALLLTSPYILNQNNEQINSVKPIADFINSLDGDYSDFFVYNDILPSIDFYTGLHTITLHAGRNTSNRELFFQKDSGYKEYYYNLTENTDFLRLTNELPSNYILIESNKRPVKGRDTILKKSNMKKKMFDKWTVYY